MARADHFAVAEFFIDLHSFFCRRRPATVEQEPHKEPPTIRSSGPSPGWRAHNNRSTARTTRPLLGSAIPDDEQSG